MVYGPMRYYQPSSWGSLLGRSNSWPGPRAVDSEGRVLRQRISEQLSCRAAASIPQCRRYVSSSTGAQQEDTRGRSIISTLRPDELTREDFLDLSGKVAVRVYTRNSTKLRKTGSLPKDIRRYAELRYHSEGVGINRTNPIRFSQCTQGFLYYFAPKFSPPLAGGIRFRITDSSDPASFSSGIDLQGATNGYAFHLPLGSIARSSSYRVFAELLQSEHLVTGELLQQAARGLGRRSRILYALKQPFILDFSRESFDCDIVGIEDNKPVVEHVRLSDITGVNSRYASYSGSAMCCFERTSDSAIVMRILNIIDPVEFQDEPGIYIPREGELLRTRTGRLWQYRVHNKPASSSGRSDWRWGLRLLQEYPDVSHILL